MTKMLSNDRNVLSLIHTDKSLVSLPSQVGIFRLEVYQCYLVAVLYQHKPVPEHTLEGGKGLKEALARILQAMNSYYRLDQPSVLLHLYMCNTDVPEVAGYMCGVVQSP